MQIIQGCCLEMKLKGFCVSKYLIYQHHNVTFIPFIIILENLGHKILIKLYEVWAWGHLQEGRRPSYTSTLVSSDSNARG